MLIQQNISSYFSRANDQLSKIQFLSGNSIKLIAILLMLFDHFCKINLQWYIANVLAPAVQADQLQAEQLIQFDWFVRSDLHAIGSIAFPLFCFFIAEGFHYTRSRTRYLTLIGVFALLSEIPFDVSFFSTYAHSAGTYPFYFSYQNVLFTFFLGLISLQLLDHFKPIVLKKADIVKVFIQTILVLPCVILAELIHADYGAYGVILIVVFYLSRNNRFYQIPLFFMFYMLTENNMITFSQLMSALILLFYNGQRGKHHLKYFFYIFYPAHMLVLYLLTLIPEHSLF